MNRRGFLTSLGVGLVTGAGLRAQQKAPDSPKNLRLHRSVLDPSDFSYVGYFSLSLGGDFCYGEGLTHRYVDGQFRLLALGRVSGSAAPTVMRLYEIVPPAVNGEVSTATAVWDDIWGGRAGDVNGRHVGIWWDEETERLWVNQAIDYPNAEQRTRTAALSVAPLGRTSNSYTGTIRGLFGIEGVGQRRHYGGVRAVPVWFRETFGTGPYLTGFGGYASLMAQGLRPAMGLSLRAIPDPVSLDLPDGGDIPESKVAVLADPGDNSTQGTDWYKDSSRQSPSAFDRGHRLAGFHQNFYDSGASYPGTPSPHWQTAPDGHGRWTWGDSYFQNCVWIDGPSKHGFFACLQAHDGNTWYQTSTLNWTDKSAEFHVFDPFHFGEVVRGQRSAVAVAPVHMWRPSEIPTKRATSAGGGQGNSSAYGVAGVTFDPRTARLYVRRTFNNGTWPYTRDRIYIYQVHV